MTDKICLFVTCESQSEGEKIAAAVVGEKLAACVNVIPGIRSCYVWEGKLTWSDEVLCLMKTSHDRFSALRDRVKELHSYSVPEVASVRFEDMLESYSKWMDDNVKPQTHRRDP